MRLQVRKQVDQANFGPGSLDVGHRRAYGRLVGGARREHRAQSLLSSQQPCPGRPRLGKHGVDQELGRSLLVDGQPKAVLQLEHVHRARIALLVRGEGEPESAAVRDDLIEFLQPPVYRPALRLGTARELVSRSLSQLRAADVVVVRGRRVWLTDERRLTAIADLVNVAQEK